MAVTPEKDQSFALEEPPIGDEAPKPKRRGATAGRRNVAGAWVSYRHGSEGPEADTLFADELEARRQAMSRGLYVVEVPWGTSVKDAVTATQRD